MHEWEENEDRHGESKEYWMGLATEEVGESAGRELHDGNSFSAVSFLL